MSKFSLKDFKNYLKQRSSEELAAELAELFSKLPAVQEYYQTRFGDQEQVVGKYKKLIYDEFFKRDGRLSVARKVVTDYKKLQPPPHSYADLMIYYVETGVEFTNTYGDIDEPFYNSMESMFEQAAKFILANGLKETFMERCRKILDNTSDIGWGFHDGLCDIFDQYLSEEKPED